MGIARDQELPEALAQQVADMDSRECRTLERVARGEEGPLPFYFRLSRWVEDRPELTESGRARLRELGGDDHSVERGIWADYLEAGGAPEWVVALVMPRDGSR